LEILLRFYPEDDVEESISEDYGEKLCYHHVN